MTPETQKRLADSYAQRTGISVADRAALMRRIARTAVVDSYEMLEHVERIISYYSTEAYQEEIAYWEAVANELKEEGNVASDA